MSPSWVSFAAAYIISCPSEYRSRPVRDDYSSLSFESDVIIRLNLLTIFNALKFGSIELFQISFHRYFLVESLTVICLEENISSIFETLNVALIFLKRFLKRFKIFY